MKTVRWGLLSTAHINRRVLPAIRMSPRARLAAVASRKKETAEAYAREWEIPVTFGSYDDMLASNEVDAVYISLPNHLHAEWSIKALKAGKAVLCEKPFAITVDEVDRVIEASKESGAPIAEAFMYRHHPQTKIVSEWLQSGRLGDIHLVLSYFSFYMGDREDNVRLAPEKGGGALWDVGIYPVSFSQFVMGGEVPEWVSGTQIIGDTGVDENFIGLLSYKGKGAAQIGCSFRTPYLTFGEIIGSKGRLSLTRPFNAMEAPDRKLVFYPDKGDPQTIKVPAQELYLGEIEDLQDALLEGKKPLINLLESRNHVRTAQALYESARIGQVIQLKG